MPPPLLHQLKRGGRLVMPLGSASGPQYLTLVTKDEAGKIEEERIMPVRFSPLAGGRAPLAEPAPARSLAVEPAPARSPSQPPIQGTMHGWLGGGAGRHGDNQESGQRCQRGERSY